MENTSWTIENLLSITTSLWKYVVPLNFIAISITPETQQFVSFVITSILAILAALPKVIEAYNKVKEGKIIRKKLKEKEAKNAK